MKTPASQWTVLLGVLVGIAGALWAASRIAQGPERVPALMTDDVAFVNVSAEPPELVLALPTDDVQRGHLERPLDEARCGTRPEVATLTALIQDADGRRIGGARVVAFAQNGGAPLLREFVEARGLDDGRACVRTPQTGAIVVGVFAPGYLPSTRRVESTVGTRIELEPFVLDSSAAIQGTVRIGGQPIARAEVEVIPCRDCDVIDVGGIVYAWREDHFVPAKVTAESDANGQYKVTGLPTGKQDVRLRALRQPNVAIDVSKAALLRVIAPAENVDFALPGARLRLDFRSGSAPVCCVDAQIEAGDRQFTRSSDDSGRLEVIIQPSLAYPIIATRRGFKTSRFQLRGLVDGERVTQTVDLEPQVSLATVRIDDERSSQVDEATFRFRPKTPLMHGLAFERKIRRDPAAGDFVMKEVPAGAWVVTMISGRELIAPSTMEGSPHLTLHSNCDAEIALTVPDTETLTAKVVVLRRGGAEVVVRDASGVRIAALAKLFDARGTEVDAVMIASELHSSFADAGPVRSDAVFVYPLTCYGTFQLAVHKEGFVPVRVSLTTQAGQSTPVEVVLQSQ